MHPKRLTLAVVVIAATGLQTAARAQSPQYPGGTSPQAELSPEDVEASPPPPSPAVYLDRSGFNELILSDAFFGLQLGSAGGTLMFQNDAPRALAMSLIGLGAGIALPIVLTLRKPVPSGEVVFANFVGRLGFTHGALIPLAASINDARVVAGLTFGLGALGVGAGLLLAPIVNLTPGQGSALGTAQTWGTFSALMLMGIIQPSTSTPELIFLAGLLGGDAATAMAFAFISMFDIDRSRVIWTDVGGYLGTGIGFGLALLLTGANSSRALFGGAFVGSIGGLAAGYLLSAGTDPYKKRVPLGRAAVTLAPSGPRFAIPVPQVTPTPTRGASGGVGLTASITALEGTL